jgi:hypothetical protein
VSVIFIDHTEPEPNSKFSLCKFKSQNKFKAKTVSTCCSKSKEIEAYKCEKRNIFPLDNNICNLCQVFESKL